MKIMNVGRRTTRWMISLAVVLLLSFLAFAAYSTGWHTIRHEYIKVKSRGEEISAIISIPRWGSGPFPAIVCVHGSGPRVADDLGIVRYELVPQGIVVLTYDKPGVGASSGQFEEIKTETSEQQLNLIADDVLVLREALKDHPLVDPKRVGLFGGSQAGWIIPIANDRQNDIPFSVIISGPATSYGMEMFFSSMTNDGRRIISDIESANHEQRLESFSGETGFEPLPTLSRSRTPTLWLFGEKDFDIPALRSAKILRELEEQGVPVTITVYPRGNHNLQDFETGRQLPYWPDILRWLRKQGQLK